MAQARPQHAIERFILRNVIVKASILSMGIAHLTGGEGVAGRRGPGPEAVLKNFLDTITLAL
jgi:hypothetical protein